MGDELTRPFHHARPIPPTRLQPVPHVRRESVGLVQGPFPMPNHYVRFATLTSLSRPKRLLLTAWPDGVLLQEMDIAFDKRQAAAQYQSELMTDAELPNWVVESIRQDDDAAAADVQVGPRPPPRL